MRQFENLKMKKIILFLSVMLSVVEASAQKQGQELIDSLQTALKNYDAIKVELKKPMYDEGDTNKVNILIKLSWELMNTGEYTKAKQYANDALAIS